MILRLQLVLDHLPLDAVADQLAADFLHSRLPPTPQVAPVADAAAAVSSKGGKKRSRWPTAASLCCLPCFLLARHMLARPSRLCSPSALQSCIAAICIDQDRHDDGCSWT